VSALVPGGRDSLPAKPALGDLLAAAERHVQTGGAAPAGGPPQQPAQAAPAQPQAPGEGEPAAKRGSAKRAGGGE
jgi:hypothetical protein